MSVTLEQVQESVETTGLIVENLAKLNEKVNNMPTIIIPSMPYVIFNGDNTGQTDVTDKIIQTNNTAVTNKTYMVLFPTGDYLIKPDRIVIPEFVEWISFGNARFFTKETVVYNVFLTMKSGSRLTHLMFDQRQDIAMLPSSQTGKGLHIIHISNVNDVTISDCTFYPSGVCSVISQHQSLSYGFNINIERNKAIWQRKIDNEFDATVFYVDAMSGRIKDNDISSIKTAFNSWRFETGIEVHSPNMIVENNTVNGCINGIIPTAWGSLYPSFDDTFRGRLMIAKNNLINCVRGISYWGSPVNGPTTARNVFILDNYINLKLEKRPKTSYYYPTEGIGLGDHSTSTASFVFKNFQIRGNRIETTYESGLNPKALMDYGPSPALQVGAFNLQTKYPCENIDISDNDVDFPLPIFNLKASGSAVHKNIRAYNNRLWNPAIYHTYQGNAVVRFDGVYNLENINGLIANHAIYGTPIELVQNGVNVSNVTGV